MTEFYFPFASLNGDRETNDTHFARFYSNLFRDGVIAPVKGALKVSEDEVLGSRVLVDAGAMLIDGRQYMLTEPRTVQIKPAESTGDRTDLVVVRLDLNARLIELRYLENATNPVRTEQIWDMVLARINVPRNATEIKNADITDMRANNAVCGYSTPYEEVRVSGLEQQYQSLLEQSFNNFEQHAQQNKQDLEQYLTDQQLLFDSWFSSVKNILDENVATNLLNMINAHELKEATETELGHVRLSDIPTPTKEAVGLGNVDNVKQASKEEFDVLATSLDEHQAERASNTEYGHVKVGSGLNVIDGVVSAEIPEMTASNVSTTNGSNVQEEIDGLKSSVSDGKELLETAITDKKGTVSRSGEFPTFTELSDGITSIPSGGRGMLFVRGDTTGAQGNQALNITLKANKEANIPWAGGSSIYFEDYGLSGNYATYVSENMVTLNDVFGLALNGSIDGRYAGNYIEGYLSTEPDGSDKLASIRISNVNGGRQQTVASKFSTALSGEFYICLKVQGAEGGESENYVSASFNWFGAI